MSKIHAAIFFACFGSLPSAWAERADRTKDLVYTADALRYDDLKQVTVLSGNVQINRGSIIIRAARIELKKDAEGYQSANAMAEAGKRVFFRQKREGVDEFVEAEAELIEYNDRQDTVQFSRNAVLRRFRGAVLSDETLGSVIVYDNKTESFSVDSPVSVPGSAVPGGRVRGVLSPRNTEPAPPSASGPANLRASPALPVTR